MQYVALLDQGLSTLQMSWGFVLLNLKFTM